MIFDKNGMMGEESNITMPQERKNRSWIVGKERIEKKMTTSTTNAFGKHPSKKVITELLETNNEKSNKEDCGNLVG